MKNCLIAVFVCCAVCAMSQDVIITAEAEKIEAKITEVSETEIKYKKWANQEGPTFVLSVSKINSIMYQNGDIQIFNKPIVEEVNLESPQIDYILDRKSTKFYYMNKRISRKEYQSIISTCPIAYDQYLTGRTVKAIGAFMFVTATCFDIIGTKAFIDGSNITSSICLSIGGLIELGCIPCFIVGGVKVGKANDTYNVQCLKKQSSVSWGISSSQNGLGLALNF